MQPVPAVPQRWRNCATRSACARRARASSPGGRRLQRRHLGRPPGRSTGRGRWGVSVTTTHGWFSSGSRRRHTAATGPVGCSPAIAPATSSSRRSCVPASPTNRNPVTSATGSELEDAYVTAAVRCAPPDNKPAPEERDRCRPFLERELSLLGGARVVPRARRLRLRSTLEDAGDERTGDSVRTRGAPAALHPRPRNRAGRRRTTLAGCSAVTTPASATSSRDCSRRRCSTRCSGELYS